MKKLLSLLIFFSMALLAFAPVPCSAPQYRQFDFWLGEWEAFGKNGKRAGDSKISLVLDSCIILEEWTSASISQGIRYAGKALIPTMPLLNNSNKPG